jgi:hypothetical protein
MLFETLCGIGREKRAKHASFHDAASEREVGGASPVTTSARVMFQGRGPLGYTLGRGISKANVARRDGTMIQYNFTIGL